MEERKPLRLPDFDYSEPYAYFITICTDQRRPVLSKIVGCGLARTAKTEKYQKLQGRRQAPALRTEYGKIDVNVGCGLARTAKTENIEKTYKAGASPCPTDSVEVCLTKIGEITEKQLLSLQHRFAGIKIDAYVIMPNHIHMILNMTEDVECGLTRTTNTEDVVKRRPTVSDIICAFKSLTVRESKPYLSGQRLFQRSFYDHVIRNEADAIEIRRYIEENPQKWALDKYYNGE